MAGPREFLIKDAAAVLADPRSLNLSGLYLSDAPGGRLSEDQIQVDNPVASDEALMPIGFDVLGATGNATGVLRQDMWKRIRAAKQYWNTRWQRSPIYLQVRHLVEDNRRYAILKGAESGDEKDDWDVMYEVSGILDSVGLNLKREHPWRGDPPGVLPAAKVLTKVDGSVNKAEEPITALGSQGTGDAPSHLYNFDSSLATFSANLIAGTSINLFKAAGETPAAGDILYIGWATRPGFHAVIPVVTAGVFTADIVPEAFISAAWTTLVWGSTFTAYPFASSEDGLFKSAGQWLLSFAPGINWQTTAINGVTAYWVRLRLNTVTSWGTQPVSHGSETPYGPRKNYLEVPAAVTAGDAPPRLMIRAQAPSGGATPGIGGLSSLIIGAMKSPGSFESVLNLHQFELPSGWAVAMGTDTAEANDTRAPSARVATTTFVTTTMETRVTLTGTSKLASFPGTFQMFLIAEQTAGAVGDVNVRARAYLGGTGAGNLYRETLSVPFRSVALGFEILDMGRMTLFTDTVGADSLTADLIFQIRAERVAGASNLKFSRLVLIPLDHFFCRAWHDGTLNGAHLIGSSQLDLDYQMLFDRTKRYDYQGGNLIPSSNWSRSSSIRRMEAASQYRLYFLLGHYASAFGSGPLMASAGAAIMASFYATNSYLTLRGNA